ncbi:MAG TPA: hypothetical protein VJ246_02685 [Patescibacteria group bacterium]|nr:hypothetical protein [Patescibacteria group bacterium]
MPFPRASREAWLPTRDEPPSEAQKYAQNLGRQIQKHFRITPLLTSREHNGCTYLQVRIPSNALGRPSLYASNLPTDRYPRLRELRAAASQDGLILEHESEAHPYVLLEYFVGVPKPASFIPAWLFFWR